MERTRVVDGGSVWGLPTRAVRRCIVIGRFIRCGEARSALVPPRVS